MTSLDVLSIEVDTMDWELRISQMKLQAVEADLELWLQKSVASKQEIASLHG